MQTRLLQLLVAAAETVADAAVTVDVEAAIEIAVEAEIGIEADVAEIAAEIGIEADVAAETEIVALAQSELLAKPRPTKETTENRRSSMFQKPSQSEIVAAMTTTSTPASDLGASNRLASKLKGAKWPLFYG